MSDISDVLRVAQEITTRSREQRERLDAKSWDALIVTAEGLQNLLRQHESAINLVTYPACFDRDLAATLRRYRELLEGVTVFSSAYGDAQGLLGLVRHFKQFEERPGKNWINLVRHRLSEFQWAAFSLHWSMGEMYNLLLEAGKLYELLSATTPVPESAEIVAQQKAQVQQAFAVQAFPSLLPKRFGSKGEEVEIPTLETREDVVELVRTWCDAWFHRIKQLLYEGGQCGICGDKYHEPSKYGLYGILGELKFKSIVGKLGGKDGPIMTETYIDFDLHIAPNGHAIASSPQGQVVSEISIEPPNDIQLALKLIEQRQTNLALLKQVGQSLYSWLFPGPIHTHLQQTEAVARNNNANLRLRLRIEPSTIARLPLEFLYRTIGGYYLAVNPDTVLSRYLNLPLPPERVRQREGPLNMLAIVADPTDQTRLDPDEWEGIIKGALAKPLADGRLTLRTVKRATRKEIRDALLAQKPDIIQFVGHGIYRDGTGYLALVDENTRKTWLVDDERFASLYMGYDDNLGLISLATCESAKGDDPQGFLGIAPKLVQRGAPAVIAMQYSVLIKTAQIFLEDFYTSMAKRKPIDWATQSARRAVAVALGYDNREFATPVLYMRAEDGVVF